MSDFMDRLKVWIEELSVLIRQNVDPEPGHFMSFLHEPELGEKVIGLIDNMNEEETEESQSYYSACIFALDICVAQLQSSIENGNKSSVKMMNQLMHFLSSTMRQSSHSLSFWLPILNAFYDVHVELSPELRDTYMDLATQDEIPENFNETEHLEAIRAMIEELSDYSTFDIAENFFAQSHAMPEDFFADLVVDLYSIEEGQDIGILTLLHPKLSVREVVIDTLESLMETITLTSVSLTRLQTIKNWYPQAYHEQFNHWIKIQRKKGVTFLKHVTPDPVKITASEVDGSGAQGLFVQFKCGRKQRLCGLLLKLGVGVKDTWMTPLISMKDVKRYHQEAFDDSVTIKDVDTDYFRMIVEHFLAVTLELGGVPDLHFLEMQELSGIHFTPCKLEIDSMMESLAVQIQPFTSAETAASFLRTKSWLKNKKFTESWYMENANIDRLVNLCSSFVDGVRICNLTDAEELVLAEEMELQRQYWVFHFLWISLWLKSCPGKYKKLWEDSFIIAYSIQEGRALKDIPVLCEISRQSVINSVETMSERRSHLNQAPQE